MKKTFSINVAGFPFTIDDDAYNLLSDYLSTIEKAFSRQEDSNEIVSDIESRIAELLLECTSSGSPIVSAADVEKVIARVGQPEDMIEEDINVASDGKGEKITVEEHETITPPPYNPPKKPIGKKLYRDPQNSILGGVCSGFAWYLNSDPTTVRLITVLIALLSVSTGAIAYIILWIVIPEAQTPLQRMEMMGEEPTVENIGKTVTDSFREDNNPSSNPPQRGGIGSTLASMFGCIAKVFIIIGMFFAVIILGAMIIGLLGCLFALITFGTSWGGTIFGEVSPFWESAGNIPLYGVLCGIGSILTLGIPLFLLVRKGWKNAKPLSTSVKTTLTILWVAGFITAGVTTGRLVNLNYQETLESNRRWEERRQERLIEKQENRERKEQRKQERLKKKEEQRRKKQEQREKKSLDKKAKDEIRSLDKKTKAKPAVTLPSDTTHSVQTEPVQAKTDSIQS